MVEIDAILAGENFSITDGFAFMEEMNAGIVKIIPRDEEDRPIAAVILLRGIDTCESILAAIEEIEGAWADEETQEETDSVESDA